MKVVDAKVAGKTWRERVEDYFSNGGTGADIARIADTEMHRIANTAALDTAKRAGARNKTWITMLDDRVRDTHDYLEGQTVSIDDDFYTYDGDHASAPGLFSFASNNVNCRCELLFS
jgi:SPP1 gp7 family putative phage head morphogenesis protein